MENTLKRFYKLNGEIKRCRRMKRFKQLEQVQEYRNNIRPKVERYINDIEGPVKRQIFYERVSRGKSWQGVAMSVGGE